MAAAAVRLAWVSMAARGIPVVPPVYCSTARSPGSAGGHAPEGGPADRAAKVVARASSGNRAVGGPAPNAASSPTTRWSSSPSASRAAACGSMAARSVVIIARAPLSASLRARARGGSSGLRCTTRAPARSTAKKLIGWYGVLGRNSATACPGPTPSRCSPAAAASTRAPNAWKLISWPRNSM